MTWRFDAWSAQAVRGALRCWEQQDLHVRSNANVPEMVLSVAFWAAGLAGLDDLDRGPGRAFQLPDVHPGGSAAVLAGMKPDLGGPACQPRAARAPGSLATLVGSQPLQVIDSPWPMTLKREVAALLLREDRASGCGDRRKTKVIASVGRVQAAGTAGGWHPVG